MNKHKKMVAMISTCVVIVLLLGALVRCQLPARLQARRYVVRGVDVSHYQGEIDWNVIWTQEISFAYIKATEGSAYADAYFEQNMIGARQAGVVPGAYHFFSFDSSAETQAEQYIKAIRELQIDKGEQFEEQFLETILIPAVDIEYYGDKRKNPPEQTSVRKSLQTMLDILEAEYDVKPMIYTTWPFYQKYIRGYFDDYPLWLRNVYFEPEEGWTIWQYADRVVLDGYVGEERYIDMDVFDGSAEEFEMLKMHLQ